MDWILTLATHFLNVIYARISDTDRAIYLIGRSMLVAALRISVNTIAFDRKPCKSRWSSHRMTPGRQAWHRVTRPALMS
jgi:hypothetical protein